MTILLTMAIIVAAVVTFTPVSRRIGVPQPVLLAAFGLLLALVPGLTDLHIPPHVILPVVLPPLLFAATQRTTAREFRDTARPVLLLAVGLTTATAAVVAVVAHTAGAAWGPAWVLGAVVAPPDPVAATAVARRLRLPHRLVTVLEGEGMFNDATALVIYQVAVGAVVAESLSTGHVLIELALALGVGVGLGLLLGWLTKLILAALHDGLAEMTVTAVMPFAAYLLAEELHGSGVLAVLGLGLYLRRFAHRATTAGGYLLGRSVWRFADFVITGVVFALIGFELTALLRDSDLDSSALVTAGAVIATVIFFRALWLYPAAAITRWHHRRRDLPAPEGWRETTVVAWAGMRGVVTIATTLALPMVVAGGADFPFRDTITFTALCCVLVTLLGQGMTLAPLVSALKVGTEHDLAGEVARLRRDATGRALEALRGQTGADMPAAVREAAIQQYEGYLAAQTALEFATGSADDPADTEKPVEALRAALNRAADIERDVILTARHTGTVSVAAADTVLDDIEARANRSIS